MFEITSLTKDNIIAFRVKGKVETSDYDKLNSHIEKLEREDRPVRLFIRIDSIEGISLKAMMKDLATYFKHARHFEKVAVVGAGDYREEAWAKAANPFMKAEVKYFPVEKQVIAENWIKE